MAAVGGQFTDFYGLFLFVQWVYTLDNLYTLHLQHESVAETLVDIGGVEFLSQLRQNCDPSLHSLIDETLEHLLRIPSTSTCELSPLTSYRSTTFCSSSMYMYMYTHIKLW